MAVSATLNQNERPVAFMSRTLQGSEFLYPAVVVHSNFMYVGHSEIARKFKNRELIIIYKKFCSYLSVYSLLGGGGSNTNFLFFS